MEKYAIVKFIGNKEKYISGKFCTSWCYCKQCDDNKSCKKEKFYLFIKDKLYKAFFLDYCQGERNVIEVQTENGEVIDYVPINDFEIIEDRYNVLNDKIARIKCVNVNGQKDLQIGKEYIALKSNEDRTMFLVLDDSFDTYYYPKENFTVLDDKDKIL